MVNENLTEMLAEWLKQNGFTIVVSCDIIKVVKTACAILVSEERLEIIESQLMGMINRSVAILELNDPTCFETLLSHLMKAQRD